MERTSTRENSPVSDLDLPMLLEAAIEAARLAGQVILGGFCRSAVDLQVIHKGAVDLVTEVDRRAEETVIQLLSRRFPHHAILCEESGEVQPGPGPLWIVDPLDGTINFAHGHPHCSVSIACALDRIPVLGVVFDPGRNELFSALAGGPARLNGQPISVGKTPELGMALLATGFPYDRHRRAEAYLPAVGAFLRAGQGVRRMGSASLDLAWLACGRLDGYWEPGLKPWDVAAGVVLVQAAGGRVTDYDGGPFDAMRPDTILASNGRIHQQMVDVLQQVREGTSG